MQYSLQAANLVTFGHTLADPNLRRRVLDADDLRISVTSVNPVIYISAKLI